MTLTIEELKYGAEVGDLGIDAVRAVCAELLANREAQPVEFIPKNLDRALGVVGLAIPESQEEFNLQSERWIQRLIDRVIRYDYEFPTPPAPAVPEQITAANAPEVFEIAAEVERLGLRGTYGAYAAGWNACRAAMLNHVGETNEKAAEKCECSSIDYCENCLRAMLAQPVSSGHKLADGWIACSERMPVDTQTVLCSNLLTELSGIPFIADYVGEFQLYDGTKYESGFYINRELQTVTHWMPLPAAPEGGNDHDTRR